jgi:hypothetical protein
MLQHMGNNMLEATLKLINMCLIIGDIPAEWRDALLYLIPKTMDWENNLTKTRPITLLETMRKAFIKIITKKLSYIIYNKQILKGGNHAVLPKESTEIPIRIINSILEDAKEKNKELWVMFQDLSKTYNHVDWDMLCKAMKRIKFPDLIIKLIINLFENSRKSVISHYRITDFYEMLIGIDQGEVISPLLWTVYYDSLLCEINSLQMGYDMSINWKSNIILT